MVVMSFIDRTKKLQKFTGDIYYVSGLNGDDTKDGSDRLFPAGGAGIFYQLNDEKMVVRADFAIGKDGNRGFYLKFGQPF